MGVVYRARDEQLRRDVAIKVLPPEALADEAARRRFRHEALILSRLNHPNIETVLGFETQDGLDFLIMEYVGGQSLEERLRAGPMPEAEAVALAMSIAEALEAAHTRGVIHCDLKPGNVGLTSDGRVKVLDFGIAQVLRPARDESTLTVLEGGGIGGTLPYMAPEQLRGKPVDGRVDLYALGVLLFRMVVGRLPFQQSLSTALVDEILHASPPYPRTLNPTVSARLEAVILRCLEKDPESRYQTAADLRADLRRLLRDTELEIQGAAPVQPPPAWKPGFWFRVIIAATTVLVAAAALAVVLRWYLLPTPGPPDRQITFTGQAYEPAISPDGMYAAYVDRSVPNEMRLLVKDLASGGALPVFTAPVCLFPRWSPDGSTILCHAVRDSEDATFLVPKLGGTARSFPAEGPLHAWSPDGRRFLSAVYRARRLMFTDTATGDTASVPLPELSARILDFDWAPRGNRIVILTTDDRGQYSFWCATPGESTIQKWFDDASEDWCPRWARDGTSIYFLRAMGQGGLKDLCKIRWPGHAPRRPVRPNVILHGLAAGEYFTLSSDDRRMLYTREVVRSNLWLMGTHRTHRESEAKLLTPGTSFDLNPAVSPDGKWVAFARGAGRLAEIYRIPIGGGEAQQLTFMNAWCRSPVWSPAGDTIAFASDKGNAHGLWRVAASGGPARAWSGIEVSDRPFAPLAWAPARTLLYETWGDQDYRVLDTRAGSTRSIGSPDSLGWIVFPQFSRDGTRVAWWSAGPRGVWVMDLATRARERIAREGPVIPLAWSADGRWLHGADFQPARTRLVRIPIGGGMAETLADIPESGRVNEVAMSPETGQIVFAIGSQQPDVWLAEAFDPAAR